MLRNGVIGDILGGDILDLIEFFLLGEDLGTLNFDRKNPARMQKVVVGEGWCVEAGHNNITVVQHKYSKPPKTRLYFVSDPS